MSLNNQPFVLGDKMTDQLSLAGKCFIGWICFFIGGTMLGLGFWGTAIYKPPSSLDLFQCPVNSEGRCCQSIYLNHTTTTVEIPCVASTNSTGCANTFYCFSMGSGGELTPSVQPFPSQSSSDHAFFIMSIVGVVVGFLIVFAGAFICGFRIR